MLKNCLFIFLGGGVGSVLRYCVQQLMHERIAPYAFPWATLTVNIAGSFLIGLFYALSARTGMSAEVRLLLTAGLCGGFTTFSTFSYDNLELLRAGQWQLCLVYALLSVGLSLGACVAGGWLARNTIT